MADYAPNFTARVRVHYSHLGAKHSFLWRITGATQPQASEVGPRLQAFLNAMRVRMFNDFQLIDWEGAAKDSDIFLPMGELPVLDYGSRIDPAAFDLQPSHKALQVRWEGKGSGGSKTSFSIFSLGYFLEKSSVKNFRVTPDEDGVPFTSLVALTELGGRQLCAIDGTPVVWRRYINVKHNDAWVADIRRG